jgi:hypothetical protein
MKLTMKAADGDPPNLIEEKDLGYPPDPNAFWVMTT